MCLVRHLKVSARPLTGPGPLRLTAVVGNKSGILVADKLQIEEKGRKSVRQVANQKVDSEYPGTSTGFFPDRKR